jgi:hypothetical protein
MAPTHGPLSCSVPSNVLGDQPRSRETAPRSPRGGQDGKRGRDAGTGLHRNHVPSFAKRGWVVVGPLSTIELNGPYLLLGDDC